MDSKLMEKMLEKLIQARDKRTAVTARSKAARPDLVARDEVVVSNKSDILAIQKLRKQATKMNQNWNVVVVLRIRTVGAKRKRTSVENRLVKLLANLASLIRGGLVFRF
ncbi:hypothetical protein ACH5RR_034248 [Cinchona calisaya]|uniref:Uncharacterized protein n=1 Tax=Cinchona calisaya TaxID=153742 RepID=A0ABD2YEX1_9GENT